MGSLCTPATGSLTATCSRWRRMPEMRELNIGHSIIARAIMVGLEQAVRDMKRLIVEASA